MVRLSGWTIDPEEVIRYLRHELKLKAVYEEILSRQIVHRIAEERGIEVAAEEIQAEADQFRYDQKLESAAQTFAWLEDQLLTPEEWEAGIRIRLLKKKLAEQLFGQQVETFFVQNKVQYEQAVLYRIVVTYQPLAQEIFYQIEEEEISFFEAAHLYDKDEHKRLTCGFEGKLSRWQLKPDIAARVFGSNPGEIVGLIQSEEGFEIWMVEEFIPAELTPEVRERILNQLFSEWIESELNYLIHSGQPVVPNGET
jgi:parvulin-like peptidyl-prolyl isomerase